MTTLTINRVRALLTAATKARILVLGDVMLDHFIWGSVSRISPEAPVPVVDFSRESYMPGGAANVARNVAALGAKPEIFGIVGMDGNAGRDWGARQLDMLLRQEKVNCDGLVTNRFRPTTLKTRVVAGRQQIVRIDREVRAEINADTAAKLISAMSKRVKSCDGVIVGDYGKGLIQQ